MTENHILPDKTLFRPDELASIFGVTRATIYLWIDHGKLEAVKIAGSTIRIPRESAVKCFEWVDPLK